MKRHRRSSPIIPANYDIWTSGELTLRGRRISVCSKLGISEPPEQDHPAHLLARFADIEGAETILDMSAGAGLAGVAAAIERPAATVLIAARNVVVYEANRRTLRANQIANGEAFLSDGTASIPDLPPVDVALVRIPKQKQVARQYIWDAWRALRPGGRLYVAGAGDEGIRPALDDVAALFGNVAVLGYGKGARVATARQTESADEPPEAFAAPWLSHDYFFELGVELRGARFAVHSRPGVFAWDRLDEGTRALAEVMDIGADHTVLDLGCGSGVLGAVAATLAPEGHVWMIDADVTAVECARRTSAANGLANCTLLASDCADAVRGLRFDRVIMNPPFHLGKATEHEVAARFIAESALLLRPGGAMYAVANRFLPYERLIMRAFGNCDVVLERGGFKVLRAIA